MENLAILASVALAAGLLIWPRLARAPLWRAAITPLASIIGSGFLVIGPILDASYGRFAPLVMALLCAVAYLFGAAIRFNIARIGDRPTRRSGVEEGLDVLSSWALSFAYVISVAYYLNLLGSFAVSLTPFNQPIHARFVTSAVFAIILFVGWTRGFAALERLEQVTVGIKLAIIAGLLAGLAIHFGKEATTGALVFAAPGLSGWPALVTAFGLLVTVQGFETARYLSDDYDAQTRIRSMRIAQIVSTAIYMVYIGLMAYVFAPDTLDLSETAIIDLMRIVAPVLPLLLIVAAVSAQFSAAVADTSGAGGLIGELTHHKVSPRASYALLVAVGLGLTWGASVFDLIAYASRAFAIYYAVQCLIAARGASGTPARVALFVALAVLAFAIAILGVPVE